MVENGAGNSARLGDPEIIVGTAEIGNGDGRPVIGGSLSVQKDYDALFMSPSLTQEGSSHMVVRKD
jgi:hypothetical protein